MIEVARSSALRALDRAEVLLDIAAAHDALGDRLVPDMFDLQSQIEVVASIAMRGVLLPLGQDVPEVDGLTPKAAIELARRHVKDATGTMRAVVTHRAGFADLTQDTPDFIVEFVLPNLWFHVSMVHAILRARGVPVGKAEFDGLHDYPDGFSFGA